MDQTPSKLVDKDGKPITTTSAAQAIQPVRIDAGRLDLLDPEDANEDAMRELERRAVFLRLGIRLALQQTAPSQYVVHRSEDGKTESVYPMGAAGASMLRFFGLTWAVPEPIQDERGQVIGYRPGDRLWRAEVRQVGEKTRYSCVESALWRGSILIALCEGKRLIGGGYSKDDVQSEQNAFENLKSRAVRTVLGLAGKDRAWYKAQGLDLSSAREVDHQDHKSATSSDPLEATLPFGREKGVKVCDASDDGLNWILPKVRESITDPKRANFKAKNEALATAIQTELDKRASKPVMDAEMAEELDRTIIAFREEAAALGVDAAKVEGYVREMKTLEQAKKALENYREKRRKRASAA